MAAATIYSSFLLGLPNLRVLHSLAGCGIGHNIEAGCGIQEILRAGCRMKISWRDQDVLVSLGGMRDSFEIVGGMRELNNK